MNELLSVQFKAATKDYYYLLNREYSQKATLKLISDHYRLSGVQRSALFRGIVTEKQANDFL